MKIKMTQRLFVASNRRNHWGGGGSMSVVMMGKTHIRLQQICDHFRSHSK